MRGGKGRDRQFRGGKGGGGKAKEVVVPATKEKVIGNQKQVEVISKVVVCVFVVVLRGIKPNIVPVACTRICKKNRLVTQFLVV